MSCTDLADALLTFVSKCESELALDLGDQGCVSDQVLGKARPRGCDLPPELFQDAQ